MKEVTARTGLTDRAVRLYIDNELITPKNQRSYTGRNNYDFTEEDVISLRQIALLRKADFSIDQIRVLLRGSQEAREVLTAFMDGKRLQMEKDSKILSALATLPADAEITVDAICEKIEEGLREDPVPVIDLKPSRAELWEAWIMRIIAGSICLAFIVFLCWIIREAYKEFPFPKLYLGPWNYLGTLYIILPIILTGTILVLYRKSFCCEDRKRRVAACILLIITVLSAVNPFGFFLSLAPPVYTETSNPAHYLQLGNCVQGLAHQCSLLFPSGIPRCAISWDSAWYPPDKFPETTKYYYKHEHDFDPCYDIYAEWVLTEDEYLAEKQRISICYPEGPVQQVRWGDWVCLNFSTDAMDVAANLDSYDYLIFAYNDKTRAVRYIASCSVDWGDRIDPYFLSLEW